MPPKILPNAFPGGVTEFSFCGVFGAPWSMIDEAVTELPFTVPCTSTLSPTATEEIVELILPFITVADDPSIW